MKNKGFTLVELLAVIVLLGLLMTIAVPSALRLNSKVKDKAYETKIDQIEQAAVNLGQANLASVSTGANIFNPTINASCKFTFDENKKVSNVDFNTKAYNGSVNPGTNEFWCSKITVKELVESGNLNYDKLGQCSGCNSTQKPYYNDVVVNPSTEYIINQCYVYLYYRNTRVYAYFDKVSCDKNSETPELGREYKPIH